MFKFLSPKKQIKDGEKVFPWMVMVEIDRISNLKRKDGTLVPTVYAGSFRIFIDRDLSKSRTVCVGSGVLMENFDACVEQMLYIAETLYGFEYVNPSGIYNNPLDIEHPCKQFDMRDRIIRVRDDLNSVTPTTNGEQTQ